MLPLIQALVLVLALVLALALVLVLVMVLHQRERPRPCGDLGLRLVIRLVNLANQGVGRGRKARRPSETPDAVGALSQAGVGVRLLWLMHHRRWCCNLAQLPPAHPCLLLWWTPRALQPRSLAHHVGLRR